MRATCSDVGSLCGSGFSEKGPIGMCTYAEIDVEKLAHTLWSGQDPNLQGELPGRVGVAATNDLLVESLSPWGLQSGLKVSSCLDVAHPHFL